MIGRWLCRFGGSIAVLCFGSVAQAQAVPTAPQAASTSAPSVVPASAAPAASPPASTAPGAALLEPPPASLAPPAAAVQVTVVTTDGAVFRGELIEKWPHRHVTVRLSTGEYRRILWQYIARLTSGADTPVNATTQVFFRSEDSDATLQRIDSGGTWFDVCRTPCAGRVASRGVYRVSGDGLRGSEPFTLSRHGPYVSIETTRVGTQGRSALGGIMAIGGGVVAYAGLLVLAASFPSNQAEGWHEETGSDDDWDEDSRGVATIMLLGGTAVGIVGLVTLLRNKTDVQLVELKRRGATQSRPTRERAGFSIPISSSLALTERGLAW